MGLLDDAIREHLELKRRRGADPVEVARAEQDALGPVRREPQDGEEPAFDSELEHPDDAGLVYEEDLAEHWEPQPAEAPLEAGAPASPDDFRRPDDHASEDAEPGWRPDPAPPLDEHPPVESSAAGATEAAQPRPAYPRRQPASSLADETAEYEVEFEHQPDDQDADDVLEETPDFFQDAPDHDRLWFEQRPPRDFNFDS
jgi:hypothetical protein